MAKSQELVRLIEQGSVKVGYMDEDIMLLNDIAGFDVSISSTQAGMNVIVGCTQGKMQMTINDRTVVLEEHDFIVVSNNRILSDLLISPNFKGMAYGCSDRMLQEIFHGHMDVWNHLAYANSGLTYRLSENTARLLVLGHKWLNTLIETTDVENNLFLRESMHSIIRGGILIVCSEFYQEGNIDGEISCTGSAQIFQKFITMLNGKKVKNRTVNEYADELCITSKYLSLICRKHSDKTASQWIQEYVMEDIRYYIQYTDYSIKEISVLLDFPNQSFFGKYVRQHFGMTPMELRTKKSKQ